MTTLTRPSLKGIFSTKAKPTEQNFADLFDSYWHLDDGVATESWVTNNFAPVSGSENYIQARNVSLQNADFWINTGRFNGPVTFGNMTADPAYTMGAAFIRTDLGKVRWGISGAFKNMATEDWVLTNAVQLNPTAMQSGAINVSGQCSMGGLTTGFITAYNAVTASQLYFGATGAQPSLQRNASDNSLLYNAVKHSFSGPVSMTGALTTGTVQTSAPSGGAAGTWSLGIPVSATVTFDTAKYVQVMINGAVVKLAVAK